MYTLTNVKTLIRSRFSAWWRRNVVAPDPDPRYSYLDLLDGLNDRKAR